MIPSHITPYTPASLRASLRTILVGRRIELHPQVGSTNDLAREAARQGEPEGLVIIAEEQLTGRGRLGRTWVAPPGCCVLCSVLLRPRFSPQQAFYLTIAASLAIYRSTLALFTNAPSLAGKPSVAIKWPNDLLVHGRKVAGILSESEFSADNWDFAVAGFGINANLDPKDLDGLASPATSLSAELQAPVDRALLLARVLSELESLYFSLQTGQFGPVHAEWAAALETLGRRVTVNDGHAAIAGQALRVDPDGALVLRDDSGHERRVLAGDVAPQP